MNLDAINELADFIADARYEFDMGEPWAQPECGSAGCIGGHAAVLWPFLRHYHTSYEDIFTWNEGLLTKHLGLTPPQINALCWEPRDQNGGEVLYHEVTRTSAVDALRRLARTGEVWFIPNL